MKAPERYYDFEKDISGCGVFGVISRKGNLIKGDMPINAMACMHDRGNGLGGGFAAYGIYPEMADKYAFHIMCDDRSGVDASEEVLKRYCTVHEYEPIPTRKTLAVTNPPLVNRYFVSPNFDPAHEMSELPEEDYMVSVIMKINSSVPGAYVFSSGKNMGAFKGVGYPEDIADFFRLDEYSAHIWTGHNRFPTNTPGWWAGAHPFTLLNWSIVHNGEISSYGINRRYLCEHDYLCSLMTDTEVVAYELDLLIRKHGLSWEMAAKVFAPPFWDEIERMDKDDKELYTALRATYGAGMLNGPFAILVADNNRLMGLNDRIKLRPLLVAEKDDMVFMSSEESSIREVCPELDHVWMPKAGEPVIVDMEA
ncbi:class II glutamine amidotransferase [Salidesulfovibrio onnuriiensis]|uniref:class II glutamine amidotransferase n=1 Tax=Salidesulfovibrio onnuriiensis TaxID=2583823 RepID=UPI0011C76D31|nr:glutamine amidotransferase family protein [Salidesulfovibrio onnuriiensis]